MAGVFLGPIDQIDHERRSITIAYKEVWVPSTIPLKGSVSGCGLSSCTSSQPTVLWRSR
jgi:hypothetical protein